MAIEKNLCKKNVKRKAKREESPKDPIKSKKQKLDNLSKDKQIVLTKKKGKSLKNDKKLKKPNTQNAGVKAKTVKIKKQKKSDECSSQTLKETTKIIKDPHKKREENTEKIPGFDHVPSDSEDEINETENKKTQPTSNSPQKKLYTDFTENTIFVGNLPLKYDKKKITKVFSKFGKVVCARIRCVPIANINMKKKVAAIKKEFNPKRNSMVAYVKFESEDSVKSAVEANGMLLDGHHIRIDSANNSGQRDSNKAIFVGGLPFDIEDDELWEFFEKCGKINSVRVIRDTHTLMGKGIGYVNFDSTTAVELALQLDGQEIKKRTINVKRCLNTMKKNKMKSFGRKKTKEMVCQLLSKKNQTKLKTKKKKSEKTNEKNTEFLGIRATAKKKKKKKPSKDFLRKKKIVKILKDRE